MLENETGVTLVIVSPIDRVAQCVAKAEELGLSRSDMDRERLLVKRQGLRTNYLGWTAEEIQDLLAVQTFELAWNNLDCRLDDQSFELFLKIRNLMEKV